MDVNLEIISLLKKEKKMLEAESLLKQYHLDCEKQREIEKNQVKNEIGKARRIFLKSEGLCVSCAKPNDNKHIRCIACQLKHKECQKRHNRAKQRKKIMEKEYLMFRELENKGKTKKYAVVLKKNQEDILAVILWSSGWRQYVLDIQEQTHWSSGCLNQVSTFLEELKNKT